MLTIDDYEEYKEEVDIEEIEYVTDFDDYDWFEDLYEETLEDYLAKQKKDYNTGEDKVENNISSS